MTALFDDIEIGLYSIASTRDNRAVAQRAEARGFRRIWLAEDFHSRDLFVQATAVATATTSIEIALGIVNPYTRHPAQIAMAVADLEELAGPRLVLGLGASWSAIGRHGIAAPRPVRALREAAEICRGLLRGDTVVYEGEVFRLPAPGAHLSFAPRRASVPLYFGTMGPRTLRMAAPLADGVLFSVFASPRFVAGRVATLSDALAAAGRSLADIDVACYVIFATDRDGAAARAAVRPLVAHYLMRLRDANRFTEAGLELGRVQRLQDTLRTAEADGRLADAVAALPDDVIDALAVAGTPAECVEQLRAYAAAGIKRAVLYHALGPDRPAAVDLIADAVRPALTAPG